MGLDYALVHLKYTIPPAILLTFLYQPLATRLCVYKVLFLITIAVAATTPWDSFLIRARIWSYPPDAIIGPTIFSIPLEEIFFFVIQTYNTSLLYLLLSKATFHSVYLRYETKQDPWKFYRLFGQLACALLFKRAVTLFKERGQGLYMAMILLWALPFISVLWTLAYQLIIGMPLTNTIVPIALPTLYLWVVDTLALRRGTWVIESGTKYGRHLWPGLDIEEAVFFLLTNTLIVFGLIAFDTAVAILTTFPVHFPSIPSLPSPVQLIRALLLPTAAYDGDRIAGLQQAVERLQKKSRSFFLASGVFSGRLRVDLVLLYSFCRVADDLVDNAATPAEAREWIKKLQTYLDYSYKSSEPNPTDINQGIATLWTVHNFPKHAQAALLQLPRDRISPEPLYSLLKGFETDLEFRSSKNDDSSTARFPIKTEEDLHLYGERVAGTVAEMCIELVFHHYGRKAVPDAQKKKIFRAGREMGTALQYINIARDIDVDAALNRVYIPTSWLKKEKLLPEDTLKNLKSSPVSGSDEKDSESFFREKVQRLRTRLLDTAFAMYEDARPAIEMLPAEARASMRVAVESYMEIGRTLRKSGYRVKQGRATVPKWKRLIVAWKALQR